MSEAPADLTAETISTPRSEAAVFGILDAKWGENEKALVAHAR